MKNYLLIVLMFLSGVGIQASGNPIKKDGNCRFDTIANFDYLTVTDRIKIDLVTLEWNEDLAPLTTEDEVARHFDFDEIGTVSITTVFSNHQEEVRNMIWRVTEDAGQPLLILTSTATDQEFIYTVEETCEGLAVTDELLNKSSAWKAAVQ